MAMPGVPDKVNNNIMKVQHQVRKKYRVSDSGSKVRRNIDDADRCLPPFGQSITLHPPRPGAAERLGGPNGDPGPERLGG